jgi:phage terminase large subunit-like protein
VIGEPPLADRRSRRIALIGDTIAQVRSIMIEGVSGLMSIYPPDKRPKLEVSKNQLVWDNGTMAQLFGADDPDSLRGPQFDAAWCDELAKWRRPDLAWDNLQFALRLGRWPQCVITTTPRPSLLLKKILEDPATSSTHSRTADNALFLSPSFLAEMRRRYGDTPIGRQELEGEIVEERLTGLWKRSHIDQSRLYARPELVRIVVAVDPPVTSTAGSDSCGIVVAGLGVDNRIGLAGERGPEAILPLARGPDGRLGVRAEGSAGISVTFNVTTPDADSFRRSETQLAALLARAVAQGQRNL